MKKQQLGRALTIIARQRAREDALHIDVDLFHAPSECHDAVTRSEHQRRRQARRHAEAVSGLPYRILVRKLGPERLRARAFLRLEDVCLDRALGGRPR